MSKSKKGHNSINFCQIYKKYFHAHLQTQLSMCDVWMKTALQLRRSWVEKDSKSKKGHNSNNFCQTYKKNLHAHLHILSYQCVKFERNPLSGLGGVALTKKKNLSRKRGITLTIFARPTKKFFMHISTYSAIIVWSLNEIRCVV